MVMGFQAQSSTTTVSTVSGITTVTTDLARTSTLSSFCDYSSVTSEINGLGYQASYDITGVTTGTLLRRRVLTITWFFQFDEPIDAESFSVSTFGLEISNVQGEVNLEEGSFIVSYDVTLTYLTYLVSLVNYCALDYVNFQFTVSPTGSSTVDT